jgi:hypothetical protein
MLLDGIPTPLFKTCFIRFIKSSLEKTTSHQGFPNLQLGSTWSIPKSSAPPRRPHLCLHGGAASQHAKHLNMSYPLVIPDAHPK